MPHDVQMFLMFVITCDHSLRVRVLLLPLLTITLLDAGEGAHAGLPGAAQAATAASHGTAGVTIPHTVPIIIVLIVQDHLAEHQEVLGGATSLGWRRLK